MKLFLDSCVVIYLVEQVEPWWERIDDALSEAVFDRLVISDLVRMECLVGPYRRGDSTTEDAFLQYFTGCEYAPINAPVFDLAARLRAGHGLKTPDAIQLATALESGCDELWTNDGRFARAAAGITIRQFA